MQSIYGSLRPLLPTENSWILNLNLDFGIFREWQEWQEWCKWYDVYNKLICIFLCCHLHICIYGVTHDVSASNSESSSLTQAQHLGACSPIFTRVAHTKFAQRCAPTHWWHIFCLNDMLAIPHLEGVEGRVRKNILHITCKPSKSHQKITHIWNGLILVYYVTYITPVIPVTPGKSRNPSSSSRFKNSRLVKGALFSLLDSVLVNVW